MSDMIKQKTQQVRVIILELVGLRGQFPIFRFFGGPPPSPSFFPSRDEASR